MTEEVVASVGETSATVNGISHTIREISWGSTQLSTVSQQTLDAAAVVDRTIRTVEERAGVSARRSAQVQREAEELGVAAVRRTLDGMERVRAAVQASAAAIESLDGRSRQIGEILEVITEVNEQTSLLALNAAILAAQAGEHGVDQINKAGGINGHLLEVIVYDTKSDTATAATLANKLIEDGVLAIIGPTSTGESMAVKPIANQAGVPLVSCAAGSVIVEPIGNYTWVFTTPQLDYVAIVRLYIYLQEQSITKIALLTDIAGFGAAGRKWLVNQTLLTKYGLTIVADGDQTYGTSDVDMQAQLTKINGTDAQAIVCWGTNPGPAIVARNMKTLGMTIHYFAVTESPLSLS